MKTMKSILTFAIALIIVALGGALPATAQTYQLKNVTYPNAARLDNVTFPAGLIVNGNFTIPETGGGGLQFIHTDLVEPNETDFVMGTKAFSPDNTNVSLTLGAINADGAKHPGFLFNSLAGSFVAIRNCALRLQTLTSPGVNDVTFSVPTSDASRTVTVSNGSFNFTGLNGISITNGGMTGNRVPVASQIAASNTNALTATATTQGVIFYSSGTGAPPSGMPPPKGAIYIQYISSGSTVMPNGSQF